jgi:hypothetical protein
MTTYEELEAKAKDHEEQVKDLRKQASEMRHAELKAKRVGDRLVYAAHSRCPCGAGLAYDPCFEDENSVFVGPLSGYWDCSAILQGVADQTVRHTGKLPFAFYEVLSEGQPSANGATTRPKG